MADLGGFVAQTRDALDVFLRTPVKRYLGPGEIDEVSPISDRFAVASITLDHAEAPPGIVVRFHWQGEAAVYAVVFDAIPGEHGAWPVTPRDCASYIEINLQEHLIAYGIESAERHERDGVTWLWWPYKSFGGRRIAVAPESD